MKPSVCALAFFALSCTSTDNASSASGSDGEQRIAFEGLTVVKPVPSGLRHHALDIVPPAPMPQDLILDCDLDRRSGEVLACRVGYEGLGMSDPEVAARRSVLGMRFDVSKFSADSPLPLRTNIPVTLSAASRLQLATPPPNARTPGQMAWSRTPTEMEAELIDIALPRVSKPAQMFVDCQVQPDLSLACLPPRALPEAELRPGIGYYLSRYWTPAASLPDGASSAGNWVQFRYDLVPRITMSPSRR